MVELQFTSVSFMKNKTINFYILTVKKKQLLNRKSYFPAFLFIFLLGESCFNFPAYALIHEIKAAY